MDSTHKSGTAAPIAGKLGKGSHVPKAGEKPTHTPKPHGGDADVAKTDR